ncbi:MAG: FecR domain-containing protein, partial [Ferruginibacter sp.]
AKHTNKPAQQEIYCGETNQAEGLPASRFGCTITLADKRKIILDSSSSTGEIARQGSIVILQPERGVIAYKGTDTISPGDTTSLYNIIQTTAGQQYQIKLMDGSTVRLNASSAIKIPVRFKKSLSLLLTGEALFDIVPDSGKLFYVRTQHAELFMADANVNVKSYPGSNTVATVISGKIIIKSNTDSAKLSEGEQAIVYTLNNRKDYTLSVRKARTADVVSWKSQIRVYSDAYMREFVSDMGRWYHLKIVSLACVPANARISISICYNASLETVFQIFRDKGLVFKREGNNIRFCAPPVKVGRS